MPPVVAAEHLSKKFRLGAVRSHEDSLRSLLTGSLKATWRAVRGQGSRVGEAAPWLWALRDVSFTVEPGDIVGIIGANGAGKSTLLKILSRITDPTEGLVRLRGRVASLLEVGTGFHPELTGRENIFLNGVVLGMSKAEVEAKFDEIVAFAELEKFLDTPIKHYSSGMYVRLGFAVAAHLDPEILVVDEALAVGDIAFQRKCLAKMAEFGKSGRTILFVSHSAAAVLSLCKRGIVLKQGQIDFDGDAKAAVERYVRAASDAHPKGTHLVDFADRAGRSTRPRSYLRRLEVYGGDLTPLAGGALPIGAAIRLIVEFELPRPMTNFDVRLNFLDLYGQVIFAARSSYEPQRGWGERRGVQRIICEIPQLPLTPGEYRLDVVLALDDRLVVDFVDNAFRLTITDSDFYGTGEVPSFGLIVQRHHWHLEHCTHNNE